MKGKFDFKEIGIQHGEKIAFGIVGLLFVYFIASSFGHNPVTNNQQPENIITTANNVVAAIRKNEVPEREEPEDYPQAYKEATRPVPAGAYGNFTVVNLPFAQQPKRGNPSYFPIDKLHVSAGIGSLAYAAGDGRVATTHKGKTLPLPAGMKLGGVKASKSDVAVAGSWIVVTGVIPYGKQREHFDSLFKNGVHPLESDVPRYGAPVVERAEVIGGQMGEWTTLDVAGGFAADPGWAGTDPFPAFDGYRQGKNTADLPPLLERNWNLENVIPRQILDLVQKEGAKVDPEERKEEPAEEPMFEGIGGAKRKERQRAPRRRRPHNVRRDSETTVPFLMFRYVDRTVEQGKSYRYRVKLFQRNPNHGVPSRFLKVPGEQQIGQHSDWSNISPTATVPHGGQVLAGEIDRKNGVARGEIMVVNWDDRTGIRTVKSFKRRIGELADYPIVDDIRDEPGMDQARLVVGGNILVDPRGAKRTKGPISAQIVGQVLVLDPIAKNLRVKETFTSGMTLVDLRGGVGKRPAEILLCDRNGKLVVRRSDDDAAMIAKNKARLAGGDDAGAAPPDDNADPSAPGDGDGFPSQKKEAGTDDPNAFPSERKSP
jgi:hypothetical protein